MNYKLILLLYILLSPLASVAQTHYQLGVGSTNILDTYL